MKYTALLIPIIVLLILGKATAQSFIQKGQVGSFIEAEDFVINPISGILVVDRGNSSVIQMDSLFNVTAELGGYGWGSEGFARPTSVATTGLRTYICDRNNARVQIYSKDLLFLYGITDDELSQSGYSLKLPQAVTVSPLGDVFIVDSEESRVLKFNYNNELTSVFGDFASGEFSLNNPTDIAYCNSVGLVAVLHNNGITFFDEFGSGVKSIIMHGVIALEYYKGSLILCSEEKIFTLSLSTFELERLVVSIPNLQPIKKAILFEGKLYILSKNSISLYEENPNR